MKKIIILTIYLFTFFSIYAQDNGFKIEGTFTEPTELDSIFLYLKDVDHPMGYTVAKAKVIDNKFVITGKTDFIRKAYLGNLPQKIAMEMVLENANYTAQINKVNYSIKGGKTNDRLYGYISNKDYIELVNQYNQISEKLFGEIDIKNDQESLEKARIEVEQYADKVMAYDDSVNNSILNNKNESELTKLLALTMSYDWENYPSEKRIEMIEKYQQKNGKHPDLEEYVFFLNNSEAATDLAESVKNGNPMKEITAKSKDGKEIVLSEVVMKNGYTILEFWASWCSPCRGEIPNLKKAYAKYKDSGFEIYAVSLDEDREQWIKAVDEEKTKWINTIMDGHFTNEMVKEYGVQGIPASFLINKEGIIVAQNEELRGENLDKTLQKFFPKK